MAIRTRPRAAALLPALALGALLAGCASPEIDQEPGLTTKSAAEVAAEQAVSAATEAEEADRVAEAEAEARPMTRRVGSYTAKKDEDLLDIARAQNLGFLELRAANPEVDIWLPGAGTEIALPNQHITAITMDDGLLINLAQMRIFRFVEGKVVDSHPLGIGREGLETPLGRTYVTHKVKNPTWRPTQRMREENPDLPAVVPPGPANPLGNRALYLDWPLYRIHGTNIPWGVGRRVSSGCIRMYPEDVETFYEKVEPGTPVEVVNQPLLAEWRDDILWVEVHPTADGWDALEMREPLPKATLTTQMVKIIADAAPPGLYIDWSAVSRAVQERRGYPVAVSGPPATS